MRLFIYVAAFAAGAGIMVLEMAGNHVLAPWFGNSLYTWTGLIGVILISISAGYYLGGTIADRFRNWIVIAHLFAIVSVSVAMVPFLDAWLEKFLGESGIVWGPILASMILFTLPACLMGALTPIAIRYASALDRDRRIGISAGMIGMLGTLGSVFGTFAGGFLLIPLLKLKIIFVCISLVMAFFAAAGYVIFAKSVRSALLWSLIAAGVAGYTMAVHRVPKGPFIVHDQMSFYHRIRITDRTDAARRVIRTLLLDSTVEGAQVIGGGELPIAYQQFWMLVKVFSPKPKALAFIGGGAFGMPEASADAYPAARIDVFELDPEVIALGKRYFRLSDYPAIHAIAGDARRNLRLKKATYDFIFGDAYNGVLYIPAHLVTSEFFKLVQGRLSEDGIFVMNIIGALEGPDAEFFRSVGGTLSREFAAVYVFATFPENRESPQNLILVGAGREYSVQASIDATDLDFATKVKFKSAYMGSYPKDARGTLLTDQTNPVEFITARSIYRSLHK